MDGKIVILCVKQQRKNEYLTWWCLVSAFCITPSIQITGVNEFKHRIASRILFPYVLSPDSKIYTEPSEKQTKTARYNLFTPSHFFFHLYKDNSTRRAAIGNVDTLSLLDVITTSVQKIIFLSWLVYCVFNSFKKLFESSFFFQNKN